jgi:UDP-glucose 4-epimerase
MIYVSGSNGLIGKELVKNISNYIPISYRNQVPDIEFVPNSTLIHLSSSITPRNNLTDLETSLQNDVLIPLQIFQNYLKINPNGKIVFLSTAGDLHSSESNIISDENSLPNPKSIYGAHKLLLENYIKLLHKTNNFTSIIFRVTNVYGGDPTPNRVNGLIDKLIVSDDITITSNIEESINFIHMNDLISLLLKSIQTKLNGYNLFLVGSSNSISIQELIKKILLHVSTTITYKNENSKPLYINIDTTKVKKYFNWECKYSIDSGILKQVKSLKSL